MTAPQMRMDKATYLAWAAAHEGRDELVDGRVVMTDGPTLGHALVTGNLLSALHRRLGRGRLEVLSNLGIDTGPNTVRGADLVVCPIGADLTAQTTSTPVLIVEVLSPSTATIDFGDKVAEYLRLPSLLAYLVVAQDEPKVWLFLRNAEDFQAPQVVVGVDASVEVPPLGLDLPMAEIFASVHGSETPQTS